MTPLFVRPLTSSILRQQWPPLRPHPLPLYLLPTPRRATVNLFQRRRRQASSKPLPLISCMTFWRGATKTPTSRKRCGLSSLPFRLTHTATTVLSTKSQKRLMHIPCCGYEGLERCPISDKCFTLSALKQIIGETFKKIEYAPCHRTSVMC